MAKSATLTLATLSVGVALTLWGAYTGELRSFVLIASLIPVAFSLVIYMRSNSIPNRELLGLRALCIYLGAFVWTRIAPWIYSELGHYLFFALCIGLTLIIGVFLYRGMLAHHSSTGSEQAEISS